MAYKSRFREKFEQNSDPYGLENMYARQRMANERLNKAAVRADQLAAVEEGSAAPMSTGLQGAALGASVGGPWGAAIGGGVGLLAGGAKDIMTRQKAGEGFGSAFGHTFVDAINPANLARGGNMANAARVAGTMKGSFGQSAGQQYLANTDFGNSNADMPWGEAQGGLSDSDLDQWVAESNNALSDEIWGDKDPNETSGATEGGAIEGSTEDSTDEDWLKKIGFTA